MENIALFLHLLGVLSFVAGVAAAGIGFERARRGGMRAGQVAVLLGVAQAGAALVAAGAVVLLAAGLWLVGIEQGVGYGTGWVDAALGLFFIAMALGAVAGRRPKRARERAEALAERGEAVDAELRALLDDRLSRAANYAAAALIVAILALMVFKP